MASACPIARPPTFPTELPSLRSSRVTVALRASAFAISPASASPIFGRLKLRSTRLVSFLLSRRATSFQPIILSMRRLKPLACVCVFVCVCARARVCMYICVCKRKDVDSSVQRVCQPVSVSVSMSVSVSVSMSMSVSVSVSVCQHGTQCARLPPRKLADGQERSRRPNSAFRQCCCSSRTPTKDAALPWHKAALPSPRSKASLT